MKWRNEQVYHLRQNKPLTLEDQDNYFNNVVNKLFSQEMPNQILFSYLENDICIGYGGIVHINWIDKNAEISFVMNTELEKDNFQKHWSIFLKLMEQVTFLELKFHKIFTYAFDLRPNLYPVLENSGFNKEAVLKEHCLYEGSFKDVVIHSKLNNQHGLNELDNLYLREASLNDSEILFIWVNDKSVRNNSIIQEPIVWENHLNWFKRKLNDSETKIFILMSGDKLLGQIRIDLIDNYWNIDYSIDNQYRGKGLGKKIVKLLLDKFEDYKFTATVKKENIASINVFANLGFKKDLSEDSVYDCFKY
jgi:RimJ/RimL family protein N-acetyltransferase